MQLAMVLMYIKVGGMGATDKLFWRCRGSSGKQLQAALVATKTDLPGQRHLVTEQEAAQWASSHGLAFFQVSAVSVGCVTVTCYHSKCMYMDKEVNGKYR